MSSKKAIQPDKRPAFLDQLGDAYALRRKNIVLLTGDIHGLFWSPTAERFLSLEQLLDRELSDKFNLMSMDIASGLGFYSPATEREVIRICESRDGVYIPAGRIKALREMIETSRNNPLSALVLLEGIWEAFNRIRAQEQGTKPFCAVFRFAGSLFPTGDYSRLSELDRQRLIAFLAWVTTPVFQNGPDLLIFLNSIRSELNPRIPALPNATHLEINLPTQKERLQFTTHFASHNKGMRFVGGKARFAEDTAGLALNNIKDMLEVAARTRKALTRKAIVAEVNAILQAQLGDIIRIKYPEHKPEDIIGHQASGQIFTDIFERCEDPDTAVAAMLVSGPNGGGKTFQLEAYAAASGRVVIELTGIRGSYFGETDKFFEMLRWHISTLGKILILVDEAHTAFGSIHSSQTHQTEQRLSGNIIKMMGNPVYLGKVLWGLMTSRPDSLDPDIKSRAPVQVPIFDLEGEERRAFIAEILRRKKIRIGDEELDRVLAGTDYYSARDFRNFTAEILAWKRKKPDCTVLDVLHGWQASKSIKRQRELQEIIAAMHCSYPGLLPERYRTMPDEELTQRAETLKAMLHQ